MHGMGAPRTRAAVGCILALYTVAWLCFIAAVYFFTAVVVGLFAWAFG